MNRFRRGILGIPFVLLVLTAGPGDAQETSAPELLRAVYERQSEMLNGIRDLTLTVEEPYPSEPESTVYLERTEGPDGSRLVTKRRRSGESDWKAADGGSDLTRGFLWLLPAGLDEGAFAGAVDGGRDVVEGREVRVVEHPDLPSYYLSGGLGDMAFHLMSAMRLFIDPERLLLVRVELVMGSDEFPEAPTGTVGYTFTDYQETSGFHYPRAWFPDPEASVWAEADRDMLEDMLAHLREQLEAVASGENPPSGGFMPISPAEKRRELESIERYLQGEPDMTFITNVKVDAGPPAGAG